MKKRFLWRWTAVLLALLLCGAARAETRATPIHECGDYTYVVLPDGSAQIVEWEGEEQNLELPGTLDGRTVSSISECAFYGCDALVSVALPGCIREIGDRAFGRCGALERVRLSEGLERIGDFAFYDCDGLTAVTLPDSLSSVGVNPFLGCSNLYAIGVSPHSAALAISNGALISRADERLICYPMALQALRYAVPEGVKTIGARAFDGALYLESVTLPDSVTVIGDEAFAGCTGLTATSLPVPAQQGR